MKNQLFKTFFLFAIFFMLPNFAEAATYFVRTDGGNATQCTGLADAPYSGSGTAQACAWSHPFHALPPTGNGLPRIAGGDTLIIGSGSYKMGYDATDWNLDVCNINWTYSCSMIAVPSGPDAQHPTRILGKNWDTKSSAAPELWGTGRAGKILNLASSSNVEVKYLEITDHEDCIYNNPNPEHQCDRSTKPFGDQADYAVDAKDSSNVLFKDINIHGLSIGGFKAGRLTDWTMDNVVVRGNGYVGWDGDIGHGAIGSGTESSNSGTITFKDSKIEFNGCGEQYPGTDIYGCFSQSRGGYGDGLGTYLTNGNWVFENTEISHNTSDGLDLLYHSGSGTITIKNSRFEGNAGNAVKIASNANIENSIIISNCDYFAGSNPQTEPGGFDNCRAAGTALVTAGWKPERQVTIANSVLTGTSTILIEAGGSTCDGSEKFVSRNNIFLGMEAWFKKTNGEPGVKSDLFYLDGIGGNGDGPCGSSDPLTKIKFDNQDSIAHNLKFNQCPNSNNVLCEDPVLTSIPPLVNANEIYTYGERWNVVPQAGSPAIDQASLSAGSTVFGSVVIPSTDILGNTRPFGAGIDWGAYEIGSGTDTTAPASPAGLSVM